MVLRAEKPDTAAVGAASWIRGWARDFDGYGRITFVRDRLSDNQSGTQNLWNEVLFGYDPNTGLLTTLTEKELEQTGFGQPISGPGHVTHSYVTTREHDLWDRVTKVTRVSAGDDMVHHHRYDTASGLVEFEDSLGAKLRWMRSGLGHVVKRSELGVPPTGGGQPLDITTHSQVDFASRIVTRTDAEGRVSKFYHDEAWRLVRQELPGYQAGGQTHLQTFTFDDASRIIQVINGRGQKVDRSYDAAGRLLAQWLVTPPADTGLRATKEVFGHDFLGRLRTVETFAGVAYDQLVVEATVQRDALGRLEQEGFEFDGFMPMWMVSGYTTPGGATDFAVRRSLDVAGVHTIQFAPDNLGRPWQYTSSSMPETNLGRYRFAGGRVAERQQGGSGMAWDLATTHGWDDLRRLTSIETEHGSTTLSRFDHTFDLEGHLIARKRDRVTVAPGGGDVFALDPVYRLAGAKVGVPPSQFATFLGNLDYAGVTTFQKETDYDLDLAQSRTQVTETWGGQGGPTTSTSYAVEAGSHRYETVGGVPFGYDGEGNLTFDGQRLYVYDFKNRLSEVWVYLPSDDEQAVQSSGRLARDGPRYAVPAERLRRLRALGQNTLLRASQLRQGYARLRGAALRASGTMTAAASGGDLELVAVYGYDAFNRRVYRSLTDTHGGETLYSTYDGWREVAEYRSNGSGLEPVRSYVWGSRLDEMLALLVNTAPVGNTPAWAQYSAQQDHQDSVDLLVDVNGAAVEKYEYDPFGRVTVYTDSGSGWENGAAYSPLGNPYGYTGRRLDAETGLMYYRNRYYWPTIGRFVTGDPLGLWADVHSVGNPYPYGANSPAFLNDPYGKQVAFLPGPLLLAERIMAGVRVIGVAVGAALGIAVDPLGDIELEDTPDPRPPMPQDGREYLWVVDRWVGLPSAREWECFSSWWRESQGNRRNLPHINPDDPDYVEPPEITNWDDPTKPPSDDPAWKWEGSGDPGSGNGNWHNTDTGQSMSPDFNHAPPIGPHWDWWRRLVGKFRVYPDRSIQPIR